MSYPMKTEDFKKLDECLKKLKEQNKSEPTDWFFVNDYGLDLSINGNVLLKERLNCIDLPSEVSERTRESLQNINAIPELWVLAAGSFYVFCVLTNKVSEEPALVLAAEPVLMHQGLLAMAAQKGFDDDITGSVNRIYAMLGMRNKEILSKIGLPTTLIVD